MANNQNQGYVDTFDGAEIAVTCDGKKIMELQSISWKASQKKEVIHAMGHVNRNRNPEEAEQNTSAIGISRGVKEYTLDVEVKERNHAIFEDPSYEANSTSEEVTRFKLGEQIVQDPLDLRNLKIVIIYPEINKRTRRPTFYGVEFTDNEGGASNDEAPGRKLSAIATHATGLV